MDIETNGFTHNEPIQITAIRYENGKALKNQYNHFFVPENKFTKSARKVNGHNKMTLKNLGAEKFTKEDGDKLVEYLNVNKDIPIVAHNVGHDRDKVLKPAFEKVSNKSLPLDNRWVCTWEMSKEKTDLRAHSLEDVLDLYDLGGRDPKAKHDAVTDCHLTAKIYMKMMEKPDKKKDGFGFMDKYLKK